MKTWIGAALAATIAATGAANAQDTRIALGATNAQSSHYAYFAALANLINEKTDGIQASVVETGATVDNLKRMERGQLDAGLVTTTTLYHANEGQYGFEGEPIDSKLLFAYSLAPQLVIVRRDSGIESLADLDGIEFGPGQRGSSTEATSEIVLGALGIEPDFVRGSNSELANQIKDDRIPGFIKSAVGTKFDPLTTDIATLSPLRVLPIPEDRLATIQEQVPELSIVDMPADEQQDRAEPYKTWAFMIAVSAAPELDEETAYRIVKAVIEDDGADGTGIQAAAFRPLEGVDIAQLTLDNASTALHPGAVRAFQEAGYTVPDRLMPQDG
ncbi:TAXI family TRAP transporter solute-binding subunit [Jannaschia sp. LMIT008]|uniref:TAXI family TRAP transporter solute-binding subunit n=1 Tax=Jannaschia maritima TaxID=3032585 RepID=UPI0028120D38|nr:TAXI family TRAP transporter solute-binding subunit [Jannaschia sp. LMIT008]